MQITTAEKIPMLYKSADIARKNSSPLFLYLFVTCNIFSFVWILQYQNKVQQNINRNLTSGVWHSAFSHIAQMTDIYNLWPYLTLAYFYCLVDNAEPCDGHGCLQHNWNCRTDCPPLWQTQLWTDTCWPCNLQILLEH